MIQFYRAVIESLLTFSITIWFGSLSQQEKAQLNKVVTTASRIIGTGLPSLENIYRQRMANRASHIIDDSTHPAHNLFQLLPSGRRYRSFKVNTTRFRDSFYPRAVQILSDRNF